jgi:hypothetical protein
VGDDLVPKQVEIDPLFRAPSLWTAKHGAIKVAGSNQIVNREGNVKRSQSRHIGIIMEESAGSVGLVFSDL